MDHAFGMILYAKRIVQAAHNECSHFHGEANNFELHRLGQPKICVLRAALATARIAPFALSPSYSIDHRRFLTMASPLDDKSFFLNSSSPTHYSSRPADEVEILLAEALKVDQLDPVVANIISANQDAFFQTFQRRVEMIKSRSQAFQDCHVTVFDKVLLELTKNGNDLTEAASITYFCEEYLGVPASASSVQKDIFLMNSLATSTSLTRGMICIEYFPCPYQWH